MYDETLSRQFGKPPENDQARIWRYMNLFALLQMLQTETKTLFFPSVATLAKIDPFEGRWNSEEAPVVRAGLKASFSKQLEMDPGIAENPGFLEMDHAALLEEANRKLVYVNCWHQNRDESAAMWAIYAAKHGVALQSRVGLLKSAFAVEERPIAICRVDYRTSRGMKDSIISLALRKRGSFSHEMELRALIVPEPSDGVGIPVKVDLGVLIEKVYLSPHSAAWMLDVVRTELRRHGLDKPVATSTLYDLA